MGLGRVELPANGLGIRRSSIQLFGICHLQAWIFGAVSLIWAGFGRFAYFLRTDSLPKSNGLEPLATRYGKGFLTRMPLRPQIDAAFGRLVERSTMGRRRKCGRPSERILRGNGATTSARYIPNPYHVTLSSQQICESSLTAPVPA